MSVTDYIIDHDAGISTIDTGFHRPGFAASHLLVEDGRAAFIDVGVSHNVPRLLAVLEHKGLAPEQVDWVLVTHVHLDHAGAAGVLLRALPKARLVVHPRGARHMIAPAKLTAGATAVYGAERMARLFGDIEPVAAARVVEAADGFSLELAGRRLVCLDTPGHARHHYCVHDVESGGVFTGDTFGVSYRELDTEQGPFILPSTSPVQFDPAALHASVDRIHALGPRALYLTHFGRIAYTPALAEAMHRHIDHYVAIAEGVTGTGEARIAALREGLWADLLAALRAHACSLPPAQVARVMDTDLRLNAQGLACWLDARARA